MTKGRSRLNQAYREIKLETSLTEALALLRIAVDDHDSNFGRVIAERVPNHWTIRARVIVDGEIGTEGER